MKFQVPQFIEVEDKIFGPLTLKQFIYLAGSAGLSFILYSVLPIYIAFILIPAVMIFGALLAFYKINNKPFINVVEASAKYFIGNKLYIWRKVEKTPERKEEERNRTSAIFVPRLSDSKLKDLAWSLDINEKVSSTIYSKESKTLIPRKDAVGR